MQSSLDVHIEHDLPCIQNFETSSLNLVEAETESSDVYSKNPTNTYTIEASSPAGSEEHKAPPLLRVESFDTEQHSVTSHPTQHCPSFTSDSPNSLTPSSLWHEPISPIPYTATSVSLFGGSSSSFSAGSAQTPSTTLTIPDNPERYESLNNNDYSFLQPPMSMKQTTDGCWTNHASHMDPEKSASLSSPYWSLHEGTPFKPHPQTLDYASYGANYTGVHRQPLRQNRSGRRHPYLNSSMTKPTRAESLQYSYQRSPMSLHLPVPVTVPVPSPLPTPTPGAKASPSNVQSSLSGHSPAVNQYPISAPSPGQGPSTGASPSLAPASAPAPTSASAHVPGPAQETELPSASASALDMHIPRGECPNMQSHAYDIPKQAFDGELSCGPLADQKAHCHYSPELSMRLHNVSPIQSNPSEPSFEFRYGEQSTTDHTNSAFGNKNSYLDGSSHYGLYNEGFDAKFLRMHPSSANNFAESIDPRHLLVESKSESTMVNSYKGEKQSLTPYVPMYEGASYSNYGLQKMVELRKPTLEGPVTPSYFLKIGPSGATETKRPENAFILYRKMKAYEFKTQRSVSNLPQQHVSKLISELWKNESAEVKSKYIARAEYLKGKHAEFFPNFQYGHRKSDQVPVYANNVYDQDFAFFTSRKYFK